MAEIPGDERSLVKGLYDKAREKFLGGTLDWDSHDMRCILVDTGTYTVDLALHDFLDDIPAGARVAVSSAMTGKTITGGVADADDVVFANVPDANPTAEAIVIYRHTGVEGTAELVFFTNEAASGLPVDPNGGNITVQWANTANRIFKL